MSNRVIRDRLFDDGFAKMARGDYAEGLESLRVASGADHLEFDPHGEGYAPATGIYTLSPMAKSAKGHRGEAVDPAALVFMGSEAEFKGFVERRTGTSPDYRIPGYANHLGQAIALYRDAEKMRYPVATERLEALKLKLGGQDFNDAERSWNEGLQRGQAHLSAQVKEIKEAYGLREVTEPPAKQGGCYVATAVYGSYNCPEVWVLRRWRDFTLLRSPVGRVLVELYYATSPKVVGVFGNQAWFTRIAKAPIDLFVARLRRAGVADSPYEDA